MSQDADFQVGNLPDGPLLNGELLFFKGNLLLESLCVYELQRPESAVTSDLGSGFWMALDGSTWQPSR
jgi:hypothetical protein